MVALLSRGTSNTYNAQFCGGSIIAPTAVLTAAHCVEDTSANQLDVLGGTIRLGNGSGQRVRATKIHLHPRWNTNTTAYDAAVIEVDRPLTSAPVPVVQPGQEALFAPGTDATVTGWGDLADGGGQYPQVLQKVTVPMVSDASCRSSYGRQFEASSMVCAGLTQGGKDSCQGDSGGPLAVRNGRAWVQVGVVSWGDGCAQPNAPGVYTRLSNLSGFIAPFVDGGGGGGGSHPFTDVPSWLTDAVDWVTAEELMDGWPDNTFRPNLTLSRAQAVRLQWRLAGSPDVAADHGFWDVPQWIDDAVRWAAHDPDGDGPAQPVMTGFRDGSFRPDEDITRGQWTRLQFRSAGEPAASQPHDFVDGAAWIDDAISWITDPARNPQYATGFDDGTFRPNADITRGQATRMVFRINAEAAA